MASSSFSLTNPQDCDLRILTEITRQSLTLLKPWTIVKPSSDPPSSQQDIIVKEIALQASKYVGAIQAGVSAAYSGFTVTEEVLFLASLDSVEDEEDLHQYLAGMMELAKQARDNAHKAHEAFRTVRTEIYATVSKLNPRALDKDYDPQKSERKVKNLPPFNVSDVETLAKFADQISAFASWWDKMNIETHPPYKPGQPLPEYLDRFKDPNLVKRWSTLRSQYAAYVQMISEMEDSDPHFFTGSWRNEALSQETVPPNRLLLTAPPPPTEATPSPRITPEPLVDHQPTPDDSKGGKSNVKDISARFTNYFAKRFPRVVKRLKLDKIRSRFRRDPKRKSSLFTSFRHDVQT